MVRFLLVCAVIFTVCTLWANAPIVMTILGLDFGLDFLIGLALGMWLAS